MGVTVGQATGGFENQKVPAAGNPDPYGREGLFSWECDFQIRLPEPNSEPENSPGPPPLLPGLLRLLGPPPSFSPPLPPLPGAISHSNTSQAACTSSSVTGDTSRCTSTRSPHAYPSSRMDSTRTSVTRYVYVSYCSCFVESFLFRFAYSSFRLILRLFVCCLFFFIFIKIDVL